MALPPAPTYISALGESDGGLYLQNCGDTMETAAPNKTDGPSGVRILPKSGGLMANSLRGKDAHGPSHHHGKASPTRALLDHTTHLLRPKIIYGKRMNE